MKAWHLPIALLVSGLFTATSTPAVETAPKRVATLVPAAADALAKIPRLAEVVATTRKLIHDPVRTGVVDLGSGHSPNVELLIGTHPDLVVADRRWHAALGDRAAREGFDVLWMEADSIESTFAGLVALGDKLGGGDVLRREVAATRDRLATLRLSKPQRALALFGAPGSVLVISGHTWIGDLLRQLGFVAVLPENATERMPGYLAASDEFLASADPDVVLLLAHGDPEAVGRAFAEEWKRVRSSSPRIVTLDPRLFATNPGLALDEAAAAIVESAPPRP
jgi:iron complex transport system substrate-binding protein